MSHYLDSIGEKIGLIEVSLVSHKIKEDEPEVEYDTAVDISYTTSANESLKLKVNVHGGVLVELQRSTHHTSYKSILPEEGGRIVKSDQESDTSSSIASIYINKRFVCRSHTDKTEDRMYLTGEEVDFIIDAMKEKGTKNVMVPMPRSVIDEIYHQGFESKLKKTSERCFAEPSM